MLRQFGVSLEMEVGRLALSVFFMAALITALARFSARSKNGKCVRKKFSSSGVGVLYNFKSDLETRTRCIKLIYYLFPLLDGALNGEDEEVTSRAPPGDEAMEDVREPVHNLAPRYG